MHPNAYLKNLWRSEVLNQVFVAMSFDPRFNDRFEHIIQPAIEAEPFGDLELRAYRVDNSKTGDSILTDIVDGIAHSRLLLADVSVIDEGRYRDTAVRNGNVMYEVGVALACRAPSDVLLIRDDDKRFLFDVSTIPHFTVSFEDCAAAISILRDAISDRLRESTLLEDARIRLAAQTLTQEEVEILANLAELKPDECRDLSHPALGMLSNPVQRGLDGLMRKGCIKSVAINTSTGAIFYGLNPFGYALAELSKRTFAQFSPDKDTPSEASGSGPV